MFKSSLGKNIMSVIGMFNVFNSQRTKRLYQSYFGFVAILYLFLVWCFCSHVFYLRTHNYFVESLDYPVFPRVKNLGVNFHGRLNQAA